jgi:hypothetical protein
MRLISKYFAAPIVRSVSGTRASLSQASGSHAHLHDFPQLMLQKPFPELPSFCRRVMPFCVRGKLEVCLRCLVRCEDVAVVAGFPSVVISPELRTNPCGDIFVLCSSLK